MKYTQKDIAKIFGLYMGASIFFNKSKFAEVPNEDAPISELSKEDIAFRTFTMLGVTDTEFITKELDIWYEHSVKSMAYNGYIAPNKLILSRLRDITDEQAITLANLWYSAEEWKVISREDFCMVLQSGESYKLWIYFNEHDDFLGFEEIYSGKENIQAHGCEAETTDGGAAIIQMVDQLREWYFALPYKGESLFESQVAIDKKTLER